MIFRPTDLPLNQVGLKSSLPQTFAAGPDPETERVCSKREVFSPL